MKRFVFSLLLAASLGTHAFAQDNAKVLDAFIKSFGYEQYENYPKAIQVMMEVYDSKNYVMNLRMGWLNHMKEDFVKAKQYYQKAIELQPKSIEARLGFVNPAAALGNWDEVIKKYDEILELDPNNTLVNYRMGYIYNTRKDYPTARTYAQKVLDLHPFDYSANALMGYIEKGLGNTAKAIAYLEIALLYNPNDQTIKDELNNIRN